MSDNPKMTSDRRAWSLAGLTAGIAGLGTSYFAAAALGVDESPVTAVAEAIIEITPGPIAKFLIDLVGTWDKPLLLLGIVLVLAGGFAWIGRAARDRYLISTVAYAALTVIGAAAVLTRPGAGTVDLLPLGVGLATWMLGLSVLTQPLLTRPLASEPVPSADAAAGLLGPQTRRDFGVRVGMVGFSAIALSVAGRFVGRGRRVVEQARGMLRLDGVTLPAPPEDTIAPVAQMTPWQTGNEDFYRIDTAISAPTITPSEWSLRIHGMVENEITLTYDDLLAREFTEAWVTLNCVSNEVGGSLIGNAWWSGTRIAPILAEAKPLPGADAVLQTSDDGWTCGTPLEALTDDRNAMLAVAMNGDALPLEHGFPVRMIVPGLYGYVSATKWVVDLEVTRFSDFTAYWTDKGWSPRGPVKMSSRIDVPRSRSVAAGEVTLAGFAWAQHTGIDAVEVQVDGGAWLPMDLAGVPSADTWVQWHGTVQMSRGDHLVRVRATDTTGLVQTSAVQDVLPDGATGLHTIQLTAD
jgi:DMSO/TMAO reductase YedYZ molybdopterin-dependent catalytic subunit